MGEYRDELTKLKREHPEMFDTLKGDQNDDPIWASQVRSNSGMFSREGEFMEKLEEAIQKDLEIYEVQRFSEFMY